MILLRQAAVCRVLKNLLWFVLCLFQLHLSVSVHLRSDHAAQSFQARDGTGLDNSGTSTSTGSSSASLSNWLSKQLSELKALDVELDGPKPHRTASPTAIVLDPAPSLNTHSNDPTTKNSEAAFSRPIQKPTSEVKAASVGPMDSDFAITSSSSTAPAQQKVIRIVQTEPAKVEEPLIVGTVGRPQQSPLHSHVVITGLASVSHDDNAQDNNSAPVTQDEGLSPLITSSQSDPKLDEASEAFIVQTNPHYVVPQIDGGTSGEDTSQTSRSQLELQALKVRRFFLFVLEAFVD